MATVYAPNVAEVLMNFTYQGEPAQNTLYFLNVLEPTETNLADLAQALYGVWETVAAPFCPSSVTLNNIEANSLDQAEAPTFTYTPPTAKSGEDILPAASNNVTIAVSFRTGLGGRSRRGRNYWVGLLEANVNNNRLDSSVRTAILGYYSGMIGDEAVAPGWRWGVYSRFSNKTPRLTGLFTPITSVVFTNDVVDSQRNRLP